MPTITLTDSTSLTADAALLDNAVLGHTPETVIRFLRDDVIHILDQPLDQVQIKSASLSLTCQPSIPLPSDEASLSIGATAGGEIILKKPADALFPDDEFAPMGSTIPMNGNVYLGLSINVSPSLTAGGTLGAYTLSLTAGLTDTAAVYLPFAKSAAGAFPNFRAALEALLSSYRLPSVQDLREKDRPWPVGSVFTFDCTGSLAFSGSIDMLAALNPTASINFSTSAGPISVTAGPAVTVTGTYTLTGEYKVRLWKKADQVVQLAYYRQTVRDLTLDFDGSLGADAEIGSFDLVAKLYGLLGDKCKLDPDWVKQHLPVDQAANVKPIFNTALAKKLALELNAEADATFTGQALFGWEFNLGTAGSVAEHAFRDALQGKLDPLLNGSKLPDGVTTLGNIFDRIREHKRTLNLNFLGLFDYADVTDAVLQLEAKTTDDGQIVLTDTAHLTRMSADATPFLKKDPLRRVLVEDGLATITYAASFGKVAPNLKVNYSFFDFESHANSADLQSFVDIANQVLAQDITPDWQTALRAKQASPTAYLYSTLTYDSAAATALFLKTGAPRPESAFTAVLRKTIQAMPPGSGLDDRFIDATKQDQTWNAMLDAGVPDAIFELLHVPIQGAPVWAHVAAAWVIEANIWASAMHSAGHALQLVTQYLQDHPHADLKNDDALGSLRRGFAGQVQNAIAKASVFGHDVSGLLNLLNATDPTDKTVEIAYGGKHVSYPPAKPSPK